MKQLPFSHRLFKILAVVLFASLLAPAGRASEGEGGWAQVSAGAKSGRAMDGTGPVPKGANPGSPELLSEDELAELSQRAEEPGPEVAGGALSNLHLTYIVIAIAAAVIVLIAK